MTLEDLETSDLGRRVGYLRGGAIGAVLVVAVIEALVVSLILLLT